MRLAISCRPIGSQPAGPVAESTRSQVDAAVTAAVEAAAGMATASPTERSAWIGTLADAIDTSAPELVRLADLEIRFGTTRLAGERADISAQLRFYASVGMDGRWLGGSVDAGEPGGAFGLVVGMEAGVSLVKAAGITAVGFTGSHSGELELWRLANERDTVIPVHTEMGTVNPVVPMNGSVACLDEVGRGFVGFSHSTAVSAAHKPGTLRAIIVTLERNPHGSYTRQWIQGNGAGRSSCAGRGRVGRVRLVRLVRQR